MTPHVTQHAFERGKERVGLGMDGFERLARIAFERGLTHAETSGALHDFVSATYLRYRRADNIRIYGEYVYLFEGHRLITVYQVPRSLRPIALKLMRRKRGEA